MKPKSRALLGRLSDADLRLLRVFKAVADCGGMAAAELELNIATSTISRHVKDLEDRLALTLCRRGRSGFALTAEGEKLYAAAEQLLSATESFRSSVHEIHRGLGGELHVALFEKTATNPRARIPQAISSFRVEAPAVSLQLHVGSIAMIERGVLSGQFQLGIIPEHRRSESLVYHELFDESMSLYAARGHPWFRMKHAGVGWKELREQPLAALGYHSPNMMLAHERHLERTATASDQEGVALLVLSGCFVGFLPDHYAEPFVRAGRMRAVAPATLRYECQFSAVHRRAPTLPTVAGLFRTALVAAHARLDR
jgi:LysR family transcriptional regulator, transcriptional activator for bauABCD operon